MIDGCIKLSDGRTLGFAEFGQMDGHPIFVFHGTPGLRFHLFSHLATKITQGNIRVIAPERPGYGLSDPKPDRTILDWAGDVQQLANHLRIERFSLVGISGGDPHAIACTYAMPHRVIKAAVICGIGPLNVPGALDTVSEEIQMCVGGGELLAAFTNQLVGMVRSDPDAFVTYFLGCLPESDRNMITKDMIPIFRDFAIEAARRTDGIIDDCQILTKP
ncbi:alpha/beta hydrolase [Fodinisporobacter ferrooxydans]|uniref:Alpha/beta hydrolase n=1 Tax=Fodinisporobacter ferrooxydans TaxID=2901836 RepID=A0ABY4CKV4_9BACL|nr:alpha/beta hydrolase [Alicyclobacillaceae bacterium MYW30-H2]